MPRIKINENVKANAGRLRPAMPGAGRPSLYQPEYADKVYKLALLGASDKEMADFFDIDVRTFYNWQKDHERFFQSIKRGKLEADAHTAHSLYHRANGYSHPAVKIFMPAGADEPVYADYVEHYPPDTGAAKHFLAVRRRRADGLTWQDRQEVSGPDGGPIPVASANMQVADPIEAAKLYAKIMGE
jgi:hypothetical protein